MILNLQNYIHFHLGAKCTVKVVNWGNTPKDYGLTLEASKKLVINIELISELQKANIKIRPMLRRIDSMTEKERFDLDVYEHGILKRIKNNPIQKRALVNAWYLENNFDVFGMIDGGVADELEDIDPFK